MGGSRKRAEYGFGEYGFKHRTQWVFWGSLSSGERTQWVPLSLLFVCKRELTEFFAELTEFAPKLSEAQWVLFSETVLSKQYSARFLGRVQLTQVASLGCQKDNDEGTAMVSQPQSITQKGVHAHPLSGLERKHWFLQHLRVIF